MVHYNSIKISLIDYIIIILSAVFMAHNSPYLGVRMPAVLFALVIILLFVTICISLAKFQNIIRFLIPIFSLYFLDIFIIQYQVLSSSEGFMRLISGMMQILLYPLLASYAIKKRNVKLAMWLLAIFLSVEFITYITSIIAEGTMPGIIRMNPGDLRDNDQVMYLMKASMNVGNFDTVYGCATLVPIGILLMKWRQELFHRRLFQLLSIVSILLMIYFVYVSQFTTALVGTLLMTLTIFCPKCLSRSYFKKTVLAGIFMAIITWSVLPPVLHFIADSIDSEIMAERFEGIAILLEGGNNSGSLDVELRRAAYEKPLQAISSTYMIGTWNNDGNGGHSHLLDTLGKYGIIGLVLLIIFYKSILNLFYTPYRNEPWVYYYLYGLLGVTFFYAFNPSELFQQILFCYPLSAFLVNYNLHKTRFNK